MTGKFITFEGPDGAGKTTQLKMLAEWLPSVLEEETQNTPQVITTREPGGTPIAEKIRSLVLDADNGEVSPQTEILLFAAARAAHVDQKIRPELAAGNWVLCDRFEDSTRAYQGAGRSLSSDTVDAACALGAQEIVPDLTVLLDVPAEISVSRRNARGADDRMESAGAEFHQRVREQFQALAASDPGRFVVLDGTHSPEDIQNLIRMTVMSRILLADPLWYRQKL